MFTTQGQIHCYIRDNKHVNSRYILSLCRIPTIPCVRGRLSLLIRVPGYSWGKDGRCVWLTTYHLQLTTAWNLEALTSKNPLASIGSNGITLPFYICIITSTIYKIVVTICTSSCNFGTLAFRQYDVFFLLSITFT
jgi:hypothetical protein